MTMIHHQVWIDAPIARVYEAISTAEGVSTWWDKQTAKKTDSDLVLEHTPGPEHGVVKMKVLELVPNKRVEWECISTHKNSTPASAWTGTHFIFELTEREQCAPANAPWAAEVPAIAILDFRQTHYDETSEYFGFNNFAWGQVLQNLKKVVEAQRS